MGRDVLRGILFSAGALAVESVLVMLSEYCREPLLAPFFLSGSVCTMLNQASEVAYFLALAGGMLAVLGVWQAGIGKRIMRSEGGGLVIVIGAIISALGFSVSNIFPFASVSAAEIWFSLGVIGGILLTFGTLKLRIPRTSMPEQGPAGYKLGWPHWSIGQWACVGALVAVLLMAATFLGMSLTLQSSGSWCGEFGPAPCPGREALNLESQTFNSPTNITLEIRNTGSASLSLIAYYVKDSAGHQFGITSWAGPSINPNGLVPVSILIDGTAFTFQNGSSYTVTVITSRNNQFTFTVLG